MKCVRCGTELRENDKICLGCGFEVGKEYIKKETSETLESLMNAPIEEEKEVEKENIEELDVDESLSISESIDGENINIASNNISEGEVLLPPKKRKKYWAILIILILGLGGFGIYKYFDYIRNISSTPPLPVINTKPNIVNNPTSLYDFGNNFIMKINSLWTLLDKGTNDSGAIKTKYFIADGSTLTLNLYNFGNDHLNNYKKNKKINVDYEEIKFNDEKYYLFTFENNKNYVKIVDNYLYAFEFFASENIDSLANEVMNNVIFYK